MQRINRWARIFIGIFGLGFVIFFHELGHFLACKLFHVGTPTFSIGFGPQLLAYRIGNTIFQIAALPLGGYVEIAAKDLARQPYAVKMVIMLAGIFFNFLLAFVIFMYLALRGKHHPIPFIKKIVFGSPADQANVQVGDRIIAFNQEPINHDASKLIQTIIQSAGKTIVFTIERDNDQHDVPITIATYHPTFGQNVGWLGVSFKRVRVAPSLWRNVIQDGFAYTASMMRKFGAVLTARRKKGEQAGLIGPIGIITMTAQSLQFGTDFFLLILAVLSINIGIFNLLPIPFFDGGKVLLYTLEAIRGPLPTNIINLIYLIFLAVILIFIFFVSMKDIARLRKR